MEIGDPASSHSDTRFSSHCPTVIPSFRAAVVATSRVLLEIALMVQGAMESSDSLSDISGHPRFVRVVNLV